MPNSFLTKPGEGRVIGTHGKNHIIFAQGDPADAIYYILKGKVKATIVSAQGKEAVVAILGAHEFFGARALRGEIERMATVTTLTEAVIIRLEKAAFVHLINTERVFSEMFISNLLDRIMRVEANLVDQLFNSSEKRLARLLLLLTNFGKEDNSEPKIVKISQETLADMIGTTRSRVSFFMNKFRNLGYIDYKHDVEVHRSLLNVVRDDQVSHELLGLCARNVQGLNVEGPGKSLGTT